MRIPNLLFLISFTLTTFICCEKENNFTISEQSIYFEFEYINGAWESMRFGWLIDKYGNINYYNKPENWRYDSGNGLSLEDLTYNLSQTILIIDSIDQETLYQKIQLIDDAFYGDLSPSITNGFDGGMTYYTAYYYDKKSNSYRKVLLAALGDFEFHNTSSAAIALTDWLKQYSVYSLK